MVNRDSSKMDELASAEWFQAEFAKFASESLFNLSPDAIVVTDSLPE